jgi:predicted signal transduction protein with EAL and GGDEF domain
MKNPFSINGLDHYLDTSIGVAYLSKHGESLEHLLHVADEAMYADKTIKRHNLSINKSIDLNIESPIKIPKDPSLNTIIQL